MLEVCVLVVYSLSSNKVSSNRNLLDSDVSSFLLIILLRNVVQEKRKHCQSNNENQLKHRNNINTTIIKALCISVDFFYF